MKKLMFSTLEYRYPVNIFKQRLHDWFFSLWINSLTIMFVKVHMKFSLPCKDKPVIMVGSHPCRVWFWCMIPLIFPGFALIRKLHPNRIVNEYLTGQDHCARHRLASSEQFSFLPIFSHYFKSIKKTGHLLNMTLIFVTAAELHWHLSKIYYANI